MRSLKAIAFAVPAVLLVLVASARAGEYTIHNCVASEQPNFIAGPWSWFGGLPNNGSQEGFQATCGPGSALGAAIGWYGPAQTSNSPVGVIIKTYPPHITIRQVRMVWSVAHQSAGSETYAQISSDAGGVAMTSSTPFTASAADPSMITLPAGTHLVEAYSFCLPSEAPDCNFSSATSPIVKVEGVDTTLEDNVPPTVSIEGGALAGSAIAGSVVLQFHATDESGVREAQLLVDGRPVAIDSYEGQCSYTEIVACPEVVSDSLSWDTTSEPNGEYDVALRVTDTSGNTTTLDAHTVSVLNAASTVGSSATGSNPATVAPECSAAQGTHTTISIAAKHNLITTPYAKRARLAGALTGPGGQPITGASVEVLSHPAITDAHTALLGHVTTNTRGHFTLLLPRGISRTICLRYHPLAGGTYLAALEIAQHISAGVTLTVKPSEIESNGTVILTGAVRGGYIFGGGKVVELQVLYRGHWRVFETVRTLSTGQFTAFYSFLGGQGTFAFRARVRGEHGYPYTLGYSRPAKVEVG
jgi:hypothetical protein